MSASEDDVIADLVEHHDQIISSLRSRLAKLQVSLVVIVVIYNYIIIFLIKGWCC